MLELGVECQQELADANDEKRDDCRDQNEYECGSQERPRKPTHLAVPPRCVSRRFAGRASARARQRAIIGAALPRGFPSSAASGPDLRILVVADHPFRALQRLAATAYLAQPVIEQHRSRT